MQVILNYSDTIIIVIVNDTDSTYIFTALFQDKCHNLGSCDSF